MNKIKFLSSIAIVLFLGCNKSNTEQKISLFETSLDQNKVSALNALVKDFEIFLDTSYPEEEEPFYTFMTEVQNNTFNWGNFEFQSELTKEKYLNSGLRDEIYIMEGNSGLSINTNGKFYKALEKTQSVKEDSIITNYLNIKRQGSLVSNAFFAEGLLNQTKDFKNYFYKRIIVVEFSF